MLLASAELLDEKEAGCGDDVEEQEGNSSEDLSEGEEGSTSAEEDEYSDALLATDPAHLDYDALLAAGAAQHRNRQPRAGFDSEEEAGQLAGIKRKRATGVRSAAVTSVEDEHFKLGRRNGSPPSSIVICLQADCMWWRMWWCELEPFHACACCR